MYTHIHTQPTRTHASRQARTLNNLHLNISLYTYSCSVLSVLQCVAVCCSVFNTCLYISIYTYKHKHKQTQANTSKYTHIDPKLHQPNADRVAQILRLFLKLLPAYRNSAHEIYNFVPGKNMVLTVNAMDFFLRLVLQ